MADGQRPEDERDLERQAAVRDHPLGGVGGVEGHLDVGREDGDEQHRRGQPAEPPGPGDCNQSSDS